MRIYEYRDFRDSVVRLYRKGGSYTKAAEKVWGFIGSSDGRDAPILHLQTTNYGENRIKNCRKYDLAGASRLITVQTDGTCILLFAGSHPDCDHWLDSNAGRIFTINQSTNVIETTRTETETSIVLAPGSSPLRTPEPLLERLPGAKVDGLLASLPYSTIRALTHLSPGSGTSEILGVTEQIPDSAQRGAINDVLCLILAGSLYEAEVRADTYLGESRLIDTFEPLDIPDIVDSEFVRAIDLRHPQYSDVIKRFAESSDYKTWMLYMHPDQEVLVHQGFKGPAKLLGVSGSGKTCVLVRRAAALAEKYPERRILVLTLNVPLANLVRRLLSACTPDGDRTRIDVLPFFELCRRLLLERAPQNERHYRQVTWKGNEHIDQIWLEFYQCRLNNLDAAVLEPVHDSLISQGYRGDRYLREEMEWIRSATSASDRARYLAMQRKGRVVPLSSEHRKAVLEGLAGWEKKMRFVGGSDVLDVANSLSLQLSEIKPRYDSVLVDESQDFGNVELEVIRALVSPGSDDLFLCGDAAQQVSSRYQNLREAGIEIPGSRSVKLHRNYRNSKDILLAAKEVLDKSLTEEMIEREDFEILDPEFSVFESTIPVLLRADNPAEEMASSLSYVQEYLEENEGRKACIAIAGHSLFEIENWANRKGLLVLNGETELDEGSIFISDLEQTKGFEFDLVCILNCSERVFPRTGDPECEWFRDLSRLYVAMTRAKLELIMSYTGNVSPFLRDVGEAILRGEWSEYSVAVRDGFQAAGFPEHISQFREDENDEVDVARMSGAEFLYTERALDLSLELIGKIRSLVDGKGLVRDRKRVRWKDVGSAAEDFRRNAFARREWGPSVARQFNDLILRLGL